MNAIEKLQELTRQCERCIWHAIIIEFEKLPENEKWNYHYYDKEKDFIVYCEKCKVYQIIQGD
jgi:hypothetical protein